MTKTVVQWITGLQKDVSKSDGALGSRSESGEGSKGNCKRREKGRGAEGAEEAERAKQDLQ